MNTSSKGLGLYSVSYLSNCNGSKAQQMVNNSRAGLNASNFRLSGAPSITSSTIAKAANQQHK